MINTQKYNEIIKSYAYAYKGTLDSILNIWGSRNYYFVCMRVCILHYFSTGDYCPSYKLFFKKYCQLYIIYNIYYNIIILYNNTLEL